jgi:hypothetical protein
MPEKAVGVGEGALVDLIVDRAVGMVEGDVGVGVGEVDEQDPGIHKGQGGKMG